ncbi:hypothetical protein QTP88_022256 [Uroleucon formosanum]
MIIAYRFVTKLVTVIWRRRAAVYLLRVLATSWPGEVITVELVTSVYHQPPPSPPTTHRRNPTTPPAGDGEPVYDHRCLCGKNGSKRKSKQKNVRANRSQCRVSVL